MIEAMSRDGINRFIEVGPGRVLTRLVDQILDGTPHKAVALDDPKVDGLRGWHRGLAALAADGVALTWQRCSRPMRSPTSTIRLRPTPSGWEERTLANRIRRRTAQW